METPQGTFLNVTTYTHTYMYNAYVCMYMYICMCVRRERGGLGNDHRGKKEAPPDGWRHRGEGESVVSRVRVYSPTAVPDELRVPGQIYALL